MIRTILVVLFLIPYMLIGCIPLFVLWLLDKKIPGLKDRGSRHLVRFAFRVILFLSGVKITTEGQEHIPADRSVLYVGNHRSLFDILISYMIFPGVTGFVAKKELGDIPLLSFWMKYIRCLFLDRENIKEGLKTILLGIEQVKSGISICIYPEGTRSRGDNELDMLDFKEGSLKIAEKSGCPVIPVAILHSAEILEKHFPKIHATHIHVRIGEPIDLKSLSKEERKFSGAYTRNIIHSLLTDMQKTQTH